MKPTAFEALNIPMIYLSKKGTGQYHLHAAIQIAEDRIIELVANNGEVPDKLNSDIYLLKLLNTSSTPENLVVKYFELDLPTTEAQTLEVMVYDESAEVGFRAGRKAKVIYSDADEGGSGGGPH